MSWIRSSKCEAHNCVEVNFRKSTKCQHADCIEVGFEDQVLVRDSKDTSGPMLQFDKGAWQKFISSL